jgi:DNA replication protein DnaC
MTTPAAARTHTAATTMDRTQILVVMSELKLFGMRSAYDEIIKTAVKRSHEPQKLVGDLLEAEIAEKQARSIKYQMTIAKLPLAVSANSTPCFAER